MRFFCALLLLTRTLFATHLHLFRVFYSIWVHIGWSTWPLIVLGSFLVFLPTIIILLVDWLLIYSWNFNVWLSQSPISWYINEPCEDILNSEISFVSLHRTLQLVLQCMNLICVTAALIRTLIVVRLLTIDNDFVTVQGLLPCCNHWVTPLENRCVFLFKGADLHKWWAISQATGSWLVKLTILIFTVFLFHFSKA